MTSFDVIRRVRRITGERKWGHLGTLDPFATGLLPLLSGNATRLIPYMDDSRKTYRAIMQFGLRTDTGDNTGETVMTMPVPELTDTILAGITPAILGITEQTPPVYSAVKVQGRPAYALSRAGKPPELAPKAVRIYSFTVLNLSHDTLEYEAEVSRGTYIRVLSETIGEMLGTCGVTTALRRLSIGGLTVGQATPLDELTPENCLPQSPEFLLSHLTSMTLQPSFLPVFRNGGKIPVELPDQSAILVRNEAGEILGVGKTEAGMLQPRTVLA
jgi:tRNA pseudouridine55 synthase